MQYIIQKNVLDSLQYSLQIRRVIQNSSLIKDGQNNTIKTQEVAFI